MPSKRTYGDVCGVARALDLVGERWSLMIVRELLLGPKRFTDLRTGLPAVGPDVLAQRLRDLDAAGLVEKRILPPPTAAKVYVLTALGRRLEPVVIALGDFGSHLPIPDDCPMRMSFDSHILSLRTLFAADRADGDLRIQLVLDDRPFVAQVHDGAFTVEPGETDAADATITGAPMALLDVCHGRAVLADADLAVTRRSRARPSASSPCSPCRRRSDMRLIVTQNITLDGVIEATEGWFEPGDGDEQADILEVMRDSMAAESAMLLGRRTFEDFRSYWPKQTDDETGITAQLNAVPKHVVSRSMDDPGWENSIVERDLFDVARRLKDADGEECVITGSMSLMGPLIEAGLVDEFRLFTYPVVIGKGVRLFGGTRLDLELLEARTFRSGVTLLRLQPSS